MALQGEGAERRRGRLGSLFGEFNFRSSNSRTHVMNDVLAALARAVHAHSAAR